jgi:hypothetical protein
MRIAPRIRQMANHDPAIHAVVRCYLNGDIHNYADLLEQALFFTHQTKVRLMEGALKEKMLEPITMVISSEDYDRYMREQQSQG